MNDHESPATKADIQALMDSIGKLYDANEVWKDEILAANKGWKDEIIRHFDVVAENIRHDLEGANRDEIEVLKDSKANHEQRISKLEHHVRLAT